MDMPPFPKMLEPKAKRLLTLELMRWSQWFFQYSFEVRHIKGKNNLILDFFIRPPYKKVFIIQSSPPIVNIHQSQIFMMKPFYQPFLPRVSDLPLEFLILFQQLLFDPIKTFHQLMIQYQVKTIEKTNPYTLGELSVNPSFPYLTLFSITNVFHEFTKNILWFYGIFSLDTLLTLNSSFHQ